MINTFFTQLLQHMNIAQDCMKEVEARQLLEVAQLVRFCWDVFTTSPKHDAFVCAFMHLGTNNGHRCEQRREENKVGRGKRLL